MTIQNKLIAFFFVLIILMSAVSFFIYQSGQQSISQYDEILQRFLLLNEIAQTNHELQTLFTRYVLVPSDEQLAQFEYHRQHLLDYQQQFEEMVATDSTRSMSKNYYHMLSYLLNRMELAFETYGQPNTREHFQYREDVYKVSSWINETTLRFINHELTDYHTFHRELLVQSQSYLTMGIVTAIILFKVSLLFTYLFCKKITDPIRLLAGQAKALSSGNFSIKDLRVTTNDEIGLLTRTFNQMKRDIHRLIKQIKQKAAVEAKLHEQTIKNIKMNQLLKEMELRTLQNQMNPHFLFNTLNMVSKLAYIEGAEKTSDLIVSISNLLRYNLRSLDKPVTLADELKHVRDYFDIQKNRFGERVSIKVDIDASCLTQPVPLLTLQPLIENAFIHGIDSLESGGEIGITVEETTTHVHVEVYDNGAGMDQDVLQLLWRQQAEFHLDDQHGHTTGIGLTNVIKRLSLFYDQEDVVDIRSKPGEGTRIILKLPKQTKGIQGGGSSCIRSYLLRMKL
ncbi:sensor histidine kinase YesM [Caldalkalibacillus uzonensis]|uniref:histidine kinase n=1 Tax=Caldalkalibacillus uzonensis TaxID=353224 RepID=A0ABU0CQF9_9BACI|nr:sensor histidine kinase [Caldalkalibacillus uzonensis]MDQ0338653.1 sensor histidine kinase YesM [Caldalkalibacillus uzonensis]